MDSNSKKGEMIVDVGKEQTASAVNNSSPLNKRKVFKKCKKFEGLVACGECDEKFEYQCYLDIHMRKHQVNYKHKCEHCGELFQFKMNLVEHAQIHKPYQCELCFLSFKKKYLLQQHMLVHNGEENFCCEFCGKKFIRQNSLTNHKRLHVQERSFICKICDKRFRSNQNLIQHHRIHTGENPFQCTHCNFHCGRKDSLQHHIRLHEQIHTHTCDMCNKAFVTKCRLERHLLTHKLKELPYKCTSCDGQFKKEFELTVHSCMHRKQKILETLQKKNLSEKYKHNTLIEGQVSCPMLSLSPVPPKELNGQFGTGVISTPRQVRSITLSEGVSAIFNNDSKKTSTEMQTTEVGCSKLTNIKLQMDGHHHQLIQIKDNICTTKRRLQM